MTQRVTVIYSPHPDDETLRLSGYASFAAARGDKLVLVAITDGGGTSLTTQWGWYSSAMMAHRRIEQSSSWTYLTNDLGEIIRLGIPDGYVSSNMATITAKVNELEALYSANSVEHYVAAHDDDAHPDHQAVVQAVRASNARVVRVSQEPGNHVGMKYLPASTGDAKDAYNAYRTIGWVSVPTLFDNLVAQGYASYITS
jgi:LmbE family N-acetylglucosaminyl deacetylase